MSDPWDYRRSDWEEPGYEVAKHTNSPPVNWSAIRRIVVHYSGVADNPDGDLDELPFEKYVAARIRSTQRYYVGERGYSIGYNAKVEQHQGTLWECRGEDFQCAANKGVNTTSVAVQVMVDGQDEATPAAVRGVHRFVRWAESKAGRVLDIVGHLDVGDTECPGAGITRQLRAGVFRPPDGSMRRRIVDTREPGNGGPFERDEVRRYDLGVGGGVLVAVTLQHQSPTSGGWLRIWGPGPEPDTSDVLGEPDWDLNTTLVRTDDTGHVSVRCSHGGHVIVDFSELVAG